ncbi:MAG: hypothetical protein FAF03_07980 [Epsilonproteobacteria bacterium]|nr:hypothetical protein [Campylobacterota bacterium]
MNKLLLVLLSTVLFLLLAVTGTLLFAFSQSGNDVLKGYIQTRLEEEIGLPVDVRKFKLEAGKARLMMRVNKQADVEVVTHYDLLSQSFSGIYLLDAKQFHYEKIDVRQAKIKGHFKGVATDVLVDGQGTALDAKVKYTFRLLESKPQNIVATMQGVSLAEVLALSGQPALADGKLDMDINMPDIGEEFANGYAKIILHPSQFNTALVETMYDLKIPNKSTLDGNVDIKLKGSLLNVLAKANSNLFHLKVDKTSVDMKEKAVEGSYSMDVKEMAILTQNKLSGAFKVVGDFTVKDKAYSVKGLSKSLGGALLFDLGEVNKFHFEKLSLSKIEHLLKQPQYLQGLLSGTADVDKGFSTGHYKLNIQKGKFGVKSIKKALGYQIPSDNSFTLDSQGEIEKHILSSSLSLKSTVSDVTLSDVVYDIKAKKLKTDYDLFVPDIGLFIPNNTAVKRGYLSVKGDLSFDTFLCINGHTNGLGEKLDFSYDSKTASVDAKGLFVEKLLSLSALPRYMKGKLSASVKLSDVKKVEGSFAIHGDKLSTQSYVMERLLGKKLAMNMSLQTKGTLKDKKAYFQTKIDSDMGKLKLNNAVFNTNTKTFKSTYTLDIPSLEKAEVLLGRKLYGSIALAGEIVKDKLLDVTGKTQSLGGSIDYRLQGDTLKSTLTDVSVERILRMLGHTPLVQGAAFGTLVYNTKSKTGKLDLDIKSFQLKANSTTNTVKMFIGKDPARTIYKTTTLNAKIDGDITRYTLEAKGSHSSITISDGVVDKKKDTHRAKFKFVYEKYVVTGAIGGSVAHPSIVIDPSAIMQSKTGEKIQKKLDKALGGDMGKAVGGFLKGIKF